MIDVPVLPVTAGEALRAWVSRGPLPLPASGRTRERWSALAELSAADLSLGRLAEAHVDAVAILSELGGPDPAAATWGVWASEMPDEPLVASSGPGRWTLTGSKAWCSGAPHLDRALVTARHGQDRLLFAIDVSDVQVRPGTWGAVGMAATQSMTIALVDVPAEQVGPPGSYLARPGFWHGAAGVAACWHGGALGAARVLRERVLRKPEDSHAAAHLGAVDAALTGVEAHLDVAAARIDADPTSADARLQAMRLRAHVEAVATEVLDRVGRATGAGPLCGDPVHAQRAADLPVFLRQSHAEQDLAVLGELAAHASSW